MGKRYYCDYCDKTMVAAPSIVKIHNNGLIHQRLLQEHYQLFKDPETILAEESKKKPCLRFAQGDCQFGRLCRYSHYTKEQLKSMNDYVVNRNIMKANTQKSFQELYSQLQNEKSRPPKTDGDKTTVYDDDGITHVFPWVYNPIFDNYGDNLPPSIKRMKISDFHDVNFMEWG